MRVHICVPKGTLTPALHVSASLYPTRLNRLGIINNELPIMNRRTFPSQAFLCEYHKNTWKINKVSIKPSISSSTTTGMDFLCIMNSQLCGKAVTCASNHKVPFDVLGHISAKFSSNLSQPTWGFLAQSSPRKISHSTEWTFPQTQDLYCLYIGSYHCTSWTPSFNGLLQPQDLVSWQPWLEVTPNPYQQEIFATDEHSLFFFFKSIWP